MVTRGWARMLERESCCLSDSPRTGGCDLEVGPRDDPLRLVDLEGESIEKMHSFSWICGIYDDNEKMLTKAR